MVQCDLTGVCRQSVSRAALAQHLDMLWSQGRIAEMMPFLAAMRKDPQAGAQLALYEGLLAAHDKDWKRATRHFRVALNDQPEWTRARLELARALYNQGQMGAADYHFRLAQNDSLPPDIARVVKDYRQSIRAQKNWDVSLQIGIAPDTNINSATSARTLVFPGFSSTAQFALSPDARSKTGIGQTLESTGRVRLKLSPVYAMDVEAQARVVNYSGSRYDDISISPAVGVSRDFGNRTRLGVAALFSQRWYGGKDAQQSIGARLRLQQLIGSSGQLQADLTYRGISNRLDGEQSGGQWGVSLAYDQAITPTAIASLSFFGLRENLANAIYANKTLGISAGVGGELPWGLNGGANVSVSRAWYDGYWPIYAVTRRDFGVQARAYLGLRSFRWLGFSPSVEYQYLYNSSNVALFAYDRHRFSFELARYF